jgi:hypothetical protein
MPILAYVNEILKYSLGTARVKSISNPNFYCLLLIEGMMRLIDGFQLALELLQKDLDVKSCLLTSGEINMNAAREVHPLKSM